MFKMCGRFPGSIITRITNPFDQVFLTVVSFAVIEDFVDFEFFGVIDGDGVWREHR